MSNMCGVHSKQERGQNLQERGEMKNVHFLGERERERERVFLLNMGLEKVWGRHTRLINVWGKLELEAPWLWWSVGEGGEGDAYSRLPWKL